MQIPRRFSLMGREFAVRDLAPGESWGEGQELYGDVDHVTATIRLDPSLPPDMKEQVFFHELAHLLFIEADLKDDSEDETLMTVFGHLLRQFFDSKQGVLRASKRKQRATGQPSTEGPSGVGGVAPVSVSGHKGKVDHRVRSQPKRGRAG